MNLLTRSYDFLLDRTPADLFGGGLALLILALLGGGLLTLGRWKRVDSFAATVGMVFVTLVLGAFLTAGFAAEAMRATGSAPYTPSNPPPGGFGPGMSLGPQIFGAADTNRDGRLTPEEAAAAAERFVREADTARQGSVDLATLAGVINRRPAPPPGGGPGPPIRFLADRFVDMVDADKDGRITLDEATRFVHRADPTGRGSVDAADIAATLIHQHSPPQAAPPKP